MRYVGVLVAGALVVTGGVAAALLSSPARAATPTLIRAAAGTAKCAVALPGGVKAVWERDAAGRQSVLSEPGSTTALIARVGGDLYDFPNSVLRSPQTADPTSYDVTAAAASTCGVSAAARPQRPHGGFTLGDLTINVLDTTGAGTSALVFLRNVDDVSLADDYFLALGGVAKAQVPVGDYAVETYTASYSAAGFAGQISINPDFKVTSGGTTVTLDARQATSKVPIPTVPQAANFVGGSLNIGRSSAEEPTRDVDWLVSNINTAFPLSITPSARVTHGGLNVVGTFELSSPTTASSPYTYHVEEPYTGRVPAVWPSSAAAGSFATVARDYYARGSSRTELVIDGAVPRIYDEGNVAYVEADLFSWAIRYLTAPLAETEYFTAGPDLIWQAGVADDLAFNELTIEAPTVYTPGQHLSQSFGQGAQHPSVELDTEGLAFECPACSSTNSLEFNLYPLSDNAGGDFVLGNQSLTNAGDFEDYSYRLLRDGVVESSSDTLFPNGIEISGLPSGSAQYQLTTTVARSVTDDPLSTSQQTVWTFTADPRGGYGVPRNWQCVDGTRDCTPLPLLYANYTVSGTSLSNNLSPGTHTLSLDLTRQQFSRASAISGASVQVSYDGGTTWTQAAMSGRDGHYAASFTIPPGAAGDLSLRVHGWDKAGNRIDQTVLNAYTLG